MANSKKQPKSFRVSEEYKNPFDQYQQNPEIKPKEIKNQKKTELEKATQELGVDLPKVNLPLGMKLVALLTLVGGLGSLASMFANIFNKQTFELNSYILQLLGGLGFMLVSYGIIKRQNWSTWLYALLVIIALSVNLRSWPFVILPAIIVVYMYLNRKYLFPSIFDKIFQKVKQKVSNIK